MTEKVITAPKHENFDVHPVSMIWKYVELLKRKGYSDNQVSFQLGHYVLEKYAGEKHDDFRTSICINKNVLTPAWLDKQFSKKCEICYDDSQRRDEQILYDFGIHSIVRVVDSSSCHITYYLPFLDTQSEFRTQDVWSENNKSIYESLKKIFGDIPVYVFDSGNAMHVYGIALLSYFEWVKFMSRAILYDNGATDIRWVAHSLNKDYGLLRWSCNNHKYLHQPILLGTLDECKVKFAIP